MLHCLAVKGGFEDEDKLMSCLIIYVDVYFHINDKYVCVHRKVSKPLFHFVGEHNCLHKYVLANTPLIWQAN